MEHESDGDTNCNLYAWYSHQRIGTEIGGLGNKRTYEAYFNYSIVEIGKNTTKSPGDLWRFYSNDAVWCHTSDAFNFLLCWA